MTKGLKYVVRKNSSGFVYRRDKTWNDPDPKIHAARATYLAAKVENGAVLGTVNAYDGAAMSAGLEHEIAYYPKSKTQGPLFVTLHKMTTWPAIASLPTMQKLLKMIDDAGWRLTMHGVVYKQNGQFVTGHDVLNEFTPVDGSVPKSGPNYDMAKAWIVAFSDLYADPGTKAFQVDRSINRMAALDLLEMRVYHELFRTNVPKLMKVPEDITLEQDLALCVYYSHSVNAPSIARKVLLASKPDQTPEWPKRLLKMLKEKKYANWEKRWERTKFRAIESGFWTKELVEEMM